MKNNFPVQYSWITLDIKIEKIADLSLSILDNLVKAVPNNNVRTFIFNNMHSLLLVLVKFPLVILSRTVYRAIMKEQLRNSLKINIDNENLTRELKNVVKNLV